MVEHKKLKEISFYNINLIILKNVYERINPFQTFFKSYRTRKKQINTLTTIIQKNKKDWNKNIFIKNILKYITTIILIISTLSSREVKRTIYFKSSTITLKVYKAGLIKIYDDDYPPVPD